MSEDLGLSGELRRAREARGESLEQVHQRTGIALRLLQGLEQGNYRVVEPIYTRLALVHYALHLGLDSDALARRFDAESGATGPRPVLVRTPQPGAPAPLPPLSPLEDLLSRQPAGRLVAVVVAVVALLAVLLYLLGTREGDARSVVDDGKPEPPRVAAPRPTAPASSAATGSAHPSPTGAVAADRPAGLPASGAQMDGASAAAGSPTQTLGSATAQAVAATAPTAVPAAATAPVAIPPTPETTIADAAMAGDAPPPPAPSLPGASAPAAATAEAPAPAPSPAGIDAQAAPAPTVPPGGAAPQPPTAPPAPGGLIMEARAVDSTWVQVEWDGSGGAVEIIPEGETRRWSADGYFLVRSGRAHGVRFRFQGHDLGRLGDATKVLRFRASAEGIQLLGPDLEPIAPLAQIQPDTTESSPAGAR